jgi:hypothetical protein
MPVMRIPTTTIRAVLYPPQPRFTRFTSVLPICEPIAKPLENQVPTHNEPRIILDGKNNLSRVSVTVNVPGASTAKLRAYGLRLILEKMIDVAFECAEGTITLYTQATTERRDMAIDNALKAYAKFCEMLDVAKNAKE